jgi:hypothetical protein
MFPYEWYEINLFIYPLYTCAGDGESFDSYSWQENLKHEFTPSSVRSFYQGNFVHLFSASGIMLWIIGDNWWSIPFLI